LPRYGRSKQVIENPVALDKVGTSGDNRFHLTGGFRFSLEKDVDADRQTLIDCTDRRGVLNDAGIAVCGASGVEAPVLQHRSKWIALAPL